MVKIAHCSDLHLDFPQANKFSHSFLNNENNADILCLLGDTTELHSANFDDKQQYLCHDFLKTVSENYPLVFFIYGNHEFYNSEYYSAKEKFSKYIKETFDNIIILDNACYEYKNIIFLGTTLWTDMNNFDPIVCSAAKYLMNDYRKISIKDKNSVRALSIEDTLNFHLKAIDFLENNLKLYKDHKVVVLSHHAPHINSECEPPRELWAAYCTDLSDMILGNPNIKFWLHGHTHFLCDYFIGSCNIQSNPRGYPNQLENYDVFKPKITEI